MPETKLKNLLDDLLTELYLPTIEQTYVGQREEVVANSRLHRAETKAMIVEDCADRLRLGIKYLMFDLEATRRENRCLRKLLEQRTFEEEDSEGEAA